MAEAPDQIAQIGHLIDGLFAQEALKPYQFEYYDPIKRLLTELDPEAQTTASRLDQLPHPRICKVLHKSQIYYIDGEGNIYQQVDHSVCTARQVGKFDGTALVINGEQHVLKTKTVTQTDDRKFMDQQKRVYETVFKNGEVLVGGSIGYINNTGDMRVTF